MLRKGGGRGGGGHIKGLPALARCERHETMPPPLPILQAGHGTGINANQCGIFLHISFLFAAGEVPDEPARHSGAALQQGIRQGHKHCTECGQLGSGLGDQCPPPKILEGYAKENSFRIVKKHGFSFIELNPKYCHHNDFTKQPSRFSLAGHSKLFGFFFLAQI